MARRQIDHVDLRVAVLGQHERQLAAIRRPGGRAVQAFEVGDLFTTTGVDVLNEDAWTLLLKRDIGNTLAVRGETRRQDRLTGLQQGYRTSTVVIRTLQGVTRVVLREAFGRHVKHTCGKRTLDTGELLERLVGNVVRHVTQLVIGTRYVTGQNLLLGSHIEQCVLDLQTSAGRRDVADHDVLRTQRFPVTENDFAGLGRQADHVLLRDRRVVAGVAQIVAYDFGHVFRQNVTALPSERHNSDGRCTVTAAGDQNVLFFCRHHCGCETENDQQSSKKVDHKARSPGVNVILNER